MIKFSLIKKKNNRKKEEKIIGRKYNQKVKGLSHLHERENTFID